MSSVSPGDFPALTVEVAFGYGPLDASPVWTDVTAYVRDIGCDSSGRDDEFDLFDAGSLDVTFANGDRRFDPTHSTGPYFGDLKSRVPIRFRATWAATTYDLWRGFVDGWPQFRPQNLRDAEARVRCTDGFKVLNAPLWDSVWTLFMLAFAPAAWYRLLEGDGTVMTDSSGNALHGVYEGGATFNHRQPIVPYSTVGGAIEFNGSEMAGLAPAGACPSGAYSVSFWATIPDDPTAGGTVAPMLLAQSTGVAASADNWVFYIDKVTGCLVTYNDAILANPRYSDAPVVSGRTYFVTSTYDGASLLLYLDGAPQSANSFGFGSLSSGVKGRPLVGGPSNASYPGFLGAISEVAFWPGALAGASISALYSAATAPLVGQTPGGRIATLVDQVGWPAGLTDLDTGLSTLGPATFNGSALELAQQVARTEAGLLHIDGAGKVVFVGRSNLRSETRFTTSQCTIGDQSGDLPYFDIATSGFDDTWVVNDVTGSRVGGTEQRVGDAASIAAHGHRPLDDRGLLLAGDGEVRDRITYRVFLRKDEQYRVDSVSLFPQQDVGLWPHALGRKIGDRVTVKEQPGATGAVIATECRIARISHRLSGVWSANGMGGGEWVTTWRLEPIDPLETSWAIVGSGAARNRVGTAKASY